MGGDGETEIKRERDKSERDTYIHTLGTWYEVYAWWRRERRKKKRKEGIVVCVWEVCASGTVHLRNTGVRVGI
jgi:hypothetical protein